MPSRSIATHEAASEWMVSFKWCRTVWPAITLLVTGLAVTASADETIARWDFDAPADAEAWRIGQHIDSKSVANGLLQLKITGRDAFLFAPPVNVPLDGCSVRVRLRANRIGSTQIYWITDDYPAYGEQQVETITSYGHDAAGDAARSEGFDTLEFTIGKPADANRRLRGFRLDPCNGAKVQSVDIDYVELVRKDPVLDAQFGFASHQVEVARPTQAWCSMKQAGGVAREQTCVLHRIEDRRDVSVVAGGLQEWGRGKPWPVEAVAGLDGARAIREVKFDRPGVAREGLVVSKPDGQALFAMESSIIVGKDESLPLKPALRSDQLRLDLIPLVGGDQRVAAARLQVASDDETGSGTRWRHVGWLLPFAQLTVQNADGVVVRYEPAFEITSQSEESVELEAVLDTPKPWQILVSMSIVESTWLEDLVHEAVEIWTTLFLPEGVRLLDLSCPVLRIDGGMKNDPLDRYALFGGLEFLGPGWRSSSDRAVGEWFADRWSPHPFKVTLPVMAIEQGGVTAAMMWDPLEYWTGSQQMPQATFASPNFLDHQNNHLMTLSVPTVPDWRRENASRAFKPYVAEADELIELRCLITAETDLPVAMTARRWYEFFDTPLPPAEPHDVDAMYGLIAQNFGDTMYWPDEKGWRAHWYMGNDSHFNGQMASALLGHALETGETKWIERTGLTGRHVVDVAGSMFGRLGNAFNASRHLQARRPDGTWPYRNSQQIRDTTRKFTEGKYDSLGEDGSTGLGTCVLPTIDIMRGALLTGDPALLEAGLSSLKTMRRFRVPSGAQVWEVHKDIPDIRAAALAVEAYHIAYRITGDEQWLDDASYWAWTGVPFAYAWHVPTERREGVLVATRDRNDWDRFSIPLPEAYQSGQPQVTPYGTVPVLGPSFYRVNWFGVLVQWCGLEWAEKVIELDRDHPDTLLRYVADGVVVSGLQQMFDRGPWVGLYPDSWHLIPNIAHAALIWAGLPLRCLQAQELLPNWSDPWTQVVRSADGSRRWHVSGWGDPAIDLPAPVVHGSWTVTLTWPQGEPNELVVAGVDEPKDVRVADKPAARAGPEAQASEPGWRYDKVKRFLFLRFTQPEPQTEVRIHW